MTNQRFLAVGVVFIAVSVVEMAAFKFSTLGLSLGAVCLIIGIAFMARSRRGPK